MVFRVALVLVRTVLGSQESLKSSPGLYETLEKIRHIPADIDEGYIVREVWGFIIQIWNICFE